MNKTKIGVPMSSLRIGEEVESVAECINSEWIGSHGEYVTAFKENLAKFCYCNFGKLFKIL